MEKEQITDFTRRIVQSNRSELTVINYEIIFAYLADAKTAHGKEQWDDFKNALRKAQNSVTELINTLNFSYDMSKNLFQIYVFCRDLLSVAMYKRGTAQIDDAERLLRKLYLGFVEAAKQDNSAPLMKNTQQVYAGYTYGKNDLVETYNGMDKSRGFFA